MFGYGKENATGRIPVFSASGVRLASCNPLKAVRLLKSGKAEAFWGAGETFYLRLKFVPKSPIILPEGEGQMVPLKEDVDVFKLIPPRKVYIKELVEVAKSNHRCLVSVKPEDWNYLEALLYGRWFELEDPGILARLAPIFKAILKGLAENSEVKKILGDIVLDFLFIDGDHTYEGVKKDFEMYSPLVKRGGMVGFHDIVPHPQETGCEVSKFWNEIKHGYRHYEIVKEQNQKWAGIGVLSV